MVDIELKDKDVKGTIIALLSLYPKYDKERLFKALKYRGFTDEEIKTAIVNLKASNTIEEK